MLPLIYVLFDNIKSVSIIFQGGHIKINLKSEIPVQVDGEPWVAAPSEVVVLKSALKVRSEII